LTIFAAAVFAAAITGAVQAQTLINPNPTPHAPAPAPASRQSKQMRPCAMYGPGFVQVPGSDLCVKIGGFVQGEVTGR
jgi:Porin subfamily